MENSGTIANPKSQTSDAISLKLIHMYIDKCYDYEYHGSVEWCRRQSPGLQRFSFQNLHGVPQISPDVALTFHFAVVQLLFESVTASVELDDWGAGGQK